MTFAPSTHLVAALFAVALLGARHGLDCDHIAALGDLVKVERRVGYSIRLGIAYIAGHSLVIAGLGSVAVCLQLSLPPALDRWMGRVVGATLVLFSAWMGVSLLRVPRHGHYHVRSRAMIIIDGGHWLYARLRRRIGRSEGSESSYLDKHRRRSSFAIGILHGFGAETPTQLLMFLMVAKLGGVIFGLIGLGLFIVGMAVVNTLLCILLAGIFRASVASDRLQRALTGITAGYSFVIGTMLLQVR